MSLIVTGPRLTTRPEAVETPTLRKRRKDRMKGKLEPLVRFGMFEVFSEWAWGAAKEVWLQRFGRLHDEVVSTPGEARLAVIEGVVGPSSATKSRLPPLHTPITRTPESLASITLNEPALELHVASSR